MASTDHDRRAAWLEWLQMQLLVLSHHAEKHDDAGMAREFRMMSEHIGEERLEHARTGPGCWSPPLGELGRGGC